MAGAGAAICQWSPPRPGGDPYSAVSQNFFSPEQIAGLEVKIAVIPHPTTSTLNDADFEVQPPGVVYYL